MSQKSSSLRVAVVTTLAAFASAAWAATPDLEEVVVTGTRVADRTRLDTLAPIDVLGESVLATQGSTELATALTRAAPSLIFPRPSATDGTDSIRPATLRGLSPDQVLVLVNTKRRHASALVNVNGSVGRGAAAVDLNAIPLIAIDRVEVLRDGASAQYGSDAIAGVLNVQLREARDGGKATISYGGYDTDVETARTSRHASDGNAVTLASWVGVGLGADGFLTLSGEYRDREYTNRSDLDPRVAPSAITARYGDPDTTDTTFYANAGLPIANGWELYGWAGYQDRDSSSAAFPRLANNSNNVPEIYPDGFLPLIQPRVKDYTFAAGGRGEWGGWNTDLSVVYGRNDLEYHVANTLNATYGATSATSFYAGSLVYDQWVADLSFVRGFDVGLVEPLNAAWGVEGRYETYQVKAGEPASYDRGAAAPDKSPGAQGFPGLQPANEVDESRNAFGAYVDVEAQLTEKLLGSVAARWEDYSDFGSALTGKVSLRYDFNDAFALRGTVSNGFRAPSLQQEYYTSTATVFVQGVETPFETGTFPSVSEVAGVLGGEPLEAEKSNNFTIGAVFRLGGFEATLDAYRIDIRDRIVLSENLSGGAITDLLAPYNVTAARFFINGVETRTTGIDAVLNYTWEDDAIGRLLFTVAANYNDTSIEKVPTSTSVLPDVVLFGRQNQLRFEEGTPESKWVLSTAWDKSLGFGELGASVRATRYGETLSAGSSEAADVVIEPAWLLDLEVRANFGEHLELTLGADNVLDEYPTKLPADLNNNGVTGFSNFSPFGFNGRFLYVRGTYRW